MFSLSAQPLEGVDIARDLRPREAGACVTFAGRVRSPNRGRDVLQLEYDAAEEPCRREFARIVEELRQNFGVIDVACAHRTGVVRAGEIAVLIAVTSVHRGAAFGACQYVIDELKKRLPIWKKEHYADGQSEWVGGNP
jgi:molybdopterin synthase catalytic subunit